MMNPKTKHCHLFIQGLYWPEKKNEYCQNLKLLALSASVIPKAQTY